MSQRRRPLGGAASLVPGGRVGPADTPDPRPKNTQPRFDGPKKNGHLCGVVAAGGAAAAALRGSGGNPAGAPTIPFHGSHQAGVLTPRRLHAHGAVRPDGTPNAGLLFTAWQQDPRTAFIPVQRRLSRGDALSRYLVHETSAVFAVLGGVRVRRSRRRAPGWGHCTNPVGRMTLLPRSWAEIPDDDWQLKPMTMRNARSCFP
ncbi:hypothetical protein [Streptomyces sp. NPDC005828]|uniref:hypothetical protein n=1 Tax=Streptomyces sp. NPDC005828 TaxID=3157071 RepID=UPI0033F6D4CB